jgi:hypothetical protein
MNDSVVEILELTATSRRTAQPPVKRGLESGLFLILGVCGIAATIYSIGYLVAFIHRDSLTRTITGFLQ